MPTRILHDALLTSPSLARCSPRAQDAFPRFLLLADDFGCFDANPRVLLGRGWSLRHDVTEEEIAAWMAEFIAAGMLRVWAEGGRSFAVLTGWAGRYGQRRREEYSDANKKGSRRRTPAPPPEAFTQVVEFPSREFPAREPTGKTNFPPLQSQSQSQSQLKNCGEESPPSPFLPVGVFPTPTLQERPEQARSETERPSLRPPLELLPTKAKRDRKPSAQEQFAQRLEAQRIRALGPDAIPDVVPVKRLNSMLGPLLGRFNADVLADAHGLYLESEYPQGCDPPYPLSLFVSQVSQWISRVTKLEAAP